MKSLFFGCVRVPLQSYSHHHVASLNPPTVIIGLDTENGPSTVRLTWPSEMAMSNDLLKLAAQINPSKNSSPANLTQ
jgi:hypothetical protein